MERGRKRKSCWRKSGCWSSLELSGFASVGRHLRGVGVLVFAMEVVVVVNEWPGFVHKVGGGEDGGPGWQLKAIMGGVEYQEWQVRNGLAVTEVSLGRKSEWVGPEEITRRCWMEFLCDLIAAEQIRGSHGDLA